MESFTTATVRPSLVVALPKTKIPRGETAAAACSNWLLPRPGLPRKLKLQY